MLNQGNTLIQEAATAAVVNNLFPAMRYSSLEAMQLDLREFQKFVADLKITKD